ncbi:hypothetical protein FOCC_FOCC008414 [Frankliniella occidentalis]|nr:hypothetical protein FOCC_FOCC008414 [Frankliniella occidentalis]
MRYLRFDIRAQRSQRLQTNKFALISDTWDAFIDNCKACYKPGAELTVDEQLFPSKTRCPFIQYIPSKPDKFGIKFWILADPKSKYMCNAAPYLGKMEDKDTSLTAGEHVVLSLADPYLKQGRNITTDNYFTSLNLAKILKSKQTSLVGTMNRARREVPQEVKVARGELHSTVFLKSEHATMTIYQGKVEKNVIVLSSMHPAITVDDSAKKLPESIKYYNSTKYGVDTVDQMARLYSVRCGTRRWPLHVFSNVLDFAAINAWVIYKECTTKKISRHSFIRQLANELSAANRSRRAISQPLATVANLPELPQSASRRKCQVLGLCTGNKTSSFCAGCKKLVCGSCAGKTIVLCCTCNEEYDVSNE